MAFKYRPYQEKAIRRGVESIQRKEPIGERVRGLYALFTGAGKTEIAVGLTKTVVDLSKRRALFFAPSRSLITQGYDRFVKRWGDLEQDVFVSDGINGETRQSIGVVMGNKNDVQSRVLMGSVQTLVDRTDDVYKQRYVPLSKDDFRTQWDGSIIKHSDRPHLVSPRMDEILANGGIPYLVVFDEAHHAVADETLRMLWRLFELSDLTGQKCHLVGMTATPQRHDRLGLMNLFDEVLFNYGWKKAEKNGYLAPFETPMRVFLQTPSHGKVNIADSDKWKDQLLGLIQEKLQGRQIIIFTGKMNDQLGGVEVSRQLAEHLNAHGVRSFHVDAERTIGVSGTVEGKDAREIYFQAFRDRKYQVYTSFGVGLEGLDLHNADTLIWLRGGGDEPNIPLITQAVGRIKRLDPDNPDKTALIVDASNTKIQLLGVASIFGYEIDEDGLYVEPEEEPEEDEEDVMLGTANLAQLSGEGLVYDGERVYEAFKILSTVNTDWYVDDQSSTFSMSLNSDEALVITAPDVTTARNILRLRTAFQAAIQDKSEPFVAEADQKYNRIYHSAKEQDKETITELLGALDYVETLFKDTCLWHVHKQRGILNQGFPVKSSRDFEDLILFSNEYALNCELEKKFAMKGQRWKSSKSAMASNKQKNFLRQLGHQDDMEALTKGDAARLITHLLFAPTVQKEIQRQRTAFLSLMKRTMQK